jgi:hypothetical protein
MLGKTRTSLLSLAVIAVLIFSAIGPTIVYADDDQPPDTTTSEAIDGDHESDSSNAGQCDSDKGHADKKSKKNKSRAKNSSECSPDGPAADTSGGDSTEEAASQPAEAAAPVAEEAAPPADPNLLTAIPENTSVTVLNAYGEAEPLATQDAASAIASTTDPIWCPAGMPPTPEQNGCTRSFPNFTELLNFLSANAITGAGTIYVEQGAYGGTESVIDFNAFNLSNISGFDLTVQGGWDTANPNPIDPAAASTSNFTVPILIGSSSNPWGGSLTINNIVITGAQSGFTLYSQESISLSYVQVTDSVTGDGALLDAVADVNISNSKFLRNNTAGARIRAGGNVAIETSEFSNTFNQRRQITGLEIVSGGSVSLADVLAVGNRRRGADITAGGRVTIGGINGSVFSETNGLNGGVFYGFGLQVITPDAIDLANVTANNNFLWGALLDAGGDVSILASVFNNNSTESLTFIDDTGLIVISDGDVVLTDVTATGNRLIGAAIDAAGQVTVTSSNFSNNQGTTTAADGTTLNHGLGLQVVSLSNVFLNGVTASNNHLFGAHVESGGEVAVSNSFFSDDGTGAAGLSQLSGLEIISAGNATVASTVLDGNQTYGSAIQAGEHAFLNLVTATNNGTDGVQVTVACTHLTGGTYSGNGQYGLNLTTSALDLALMPTFGPPNNVLGDIFPAIPPTCPPAVIINPPAISSNLGNPVGTSSQQGSSSNSGASNLLQAGSLISNTGNGVSGTALVGLSLNGTFGITRDVTADAVVTSIFVGNYVYVYTIYNVDAEPSLDNLQIMVLSPAPLTGVARVGP